MCWFWKRSPGHLVSSFINSFLFYEKKSIFLIFFFLIPWKSHFQFTAFCMTSDWDTKQRLILLSAVSHEFNLAFSLDILSWSVLPEFNCNNNRRGYFYFFLLSYWSAVSCVVFACSLGSRKYDQGRTRTPCCDHGVWSKQANLSEGLFL